MSALRDVALRALSVSTWRSRQQIEDEASRRFAWLAERLTEAGAPASLADLARRASEDERRHAQHCETVVTGWGAEPAPVDGALATYAPRGLRADERLCYELVAQCCLAETESTATLLQLLRDTATPSLRPLLHELARDEVRHSQLGWAYLTWVGPRLDLSFLAPLLPRMLDGNAGPDFFAPPTELDDDPGLLRDGVVPASVRQRLYLDTLEEVVLPGFSHFGIDVGLARAWLADRRATAAA